MNTKYLAIVIIVSLIVVGIFMFLRYNLYSAATLSDKNLLTIYYPPIGQVSEQYREYKNLLFGFSLTYPKYLRVKEYDDGTSASTITFEDEHGEKGFQIFIVPYSKDYIENEQLKKDLPSGLVLEPTDIMVDSIKATAFYSKNGTMGNTREIWFIYKGFLYEISTYKELGVWLAEIMRTWQFQ